MGEKMQRVKLTGGTRDGESFDVYACQPTVYLAKRISASEKSGLKIDDVVCWKTRKKYTNGRQTGASFIGKRCITNRKIKTPNA